GYSLLPDHQRKGIMQEALKAVLDFGFNVLQLHSLEANASPENEASLKLLEKNNFIREGYFKENYFFEGRFSDTVTYSLLASKTSSL
ncbi:MAG TPA: GNAT family protein, partial [Chitinophagaceae bacterium]